MKTVRYRKPYTLISRGGIWYYRTWENGKRIAKSTGMTSKVLARSYCDNLLKLNKLNEKRYLLNDYAEDFFSPGSIWYEDRGKELAPKTLISYRAALRLYILPLLGQEPLTAINYSMVKQFKIKLLETKSKSTVSIILSILSIILTYALRDDLITVNPVTLLDGIREPYKHRDAYSRKEVKELVLNAPNMRMSRYIAFLACTGMRIGEAKGVVADDVVSLPNISYISLTKQLQGKEYKPLKNKKARVIPLCNRLLDAIDIKTPYISLVRYIKKQSYVMDLEGTRKLTVHSLRHFFVTDAKSHGVNALKVETIVGHSIKGIEGVYTNFKPEDLKDIIQWQEELLAYIFE